MEVEQEPIQNWYFQKGKKNVTKRKAALHMAKFIDAPTKTGQSPLVQVSKDVDWSAVVVSHLHS